jgi:hypothetical protein
MFVFISLNPLKVKWKTLVKTVLLIGLLVYIIPKLVLAISGINQPPVQQKLRDNPIRETPIKVESKHATCS